MIMRGVSAEGDLYLDFGVPGNHLSRPGFDAFRAKALGDRTVSHLFVPRRDRIARPDNPVDALVIESELRSAGLAIVLMGGKVLEPFQRGQRIDLADLLIGLIDYDTSGRFRRELAEKLIHAKIRLARAGFSIGGEPMYGFRRWLCSEDGTLKRELEVHEIVKLPGHHVIWLPTAEAELAVVARILDTIETTPARRIARTFSEEGIPSPKAGHIRTVRGVPVANSGQWTANTVKNIATHPLLIAVCEYGKRSEGDQLRLTNHGPRPLGKQDYRENGRPKTVRNPADQIIRSPARSKPLTTPEKQARICKVLEQRGRHLKGKPRGHGNAPNPLGGRIYDLNCGWPMYRYQRRGKWCYTCALYQNSEAKCCDHNTVVGQVSTRFVLSCLRQRVFSPSAMAALRARLRELAAAERDDASRERQLNTGKAGVSDIRRKLALAARNMALAATSDEHNAMAAVFRELKAEEARLQQRIAASDCEQKPGDPDREVESALALLDRLPDLVASADANWESIGRLFREVDARLHLRFEKVDYGRRQQNVPAGGVVTFGAMPAPGPIYEGPTDRAIIRQMLADGEPVSPVPGCVAPGTVNARTEVGGSANVQRGTT
jgi:hypothetical protein